MNSSILVEAALRSVFLALAVWMGLGVLKVRNVLAQKAVWGLVLAGALAMPLVLPMVSHWSVLPANVRVVLPADPETLLEELQARIQAKTSPEQKPAAVVTSSEGTSQIEQQPEPTVNEPIGNRAAAATEPVSSDAVRVEYMSQPTAQTESAAPSAVVQPRTALSLSKILLLVYLAVAGIFLIRLACGLIAALRLWRRAKAISSELLTASGAPVDLRCSTEVSSPVTICSAIVLPADYAAWDSEKLRVVLAHERSHIRQRDFYLQLLAGVYAAVVWFSPLGWWLKRKLSDLAEAISDRAGLEEAADRASYAQILLEFAAAPRPTLIGVAMARNGSLSRRIERLLNDVSFRQAFAGSSRALAAVLVVPVVLFAVTALVRVQAAGQQAPEPPAPAAAPQSGVVAPAPPAAIAPAAPVSGVSQPEPVGELAPAAPVDVQPQHAQAGELGGIPPTPATPRVLIITPTPPTAGTLQMLAKGPLTLIAPKAPGMPGNASLIVVPRGAHTMTLIAPRAGYGAGRGYGVGQSTTSESGTASYSENGKHSGYHYSYSSNGESYAVIRGGDKEHMTFSGNWIEGRRDEIEKARKQAAGKDFLWFTRDGKAYLVDDPATVAQIEAMYKPMEELGRQQEELGKKQEVLGKQQEELGKQQEATSVPTPDMSKEIARIDEAMAKLKASQGKNLNQDQFADLQEKLGELQSRIGEIQGQIGEKQGEFGERMGELGGKMGALGSQMGELGAQQGKIAQEADRKIKSIIDESMKNGRARPVQ
ncbi:MAG TPA: M56 family metallopeptidase [Terracidiphilus sp.]|nr:M56 family metallopeptidase [Terracidiphilus sp.]